MPKQGRTSPPPRAGCIPPVPAMWPTPALLSPCWAPRSAPRAQFPGRPLTALGLRGIALRPGRWGPSLRTGVPPAQGGQDMKGDSPRGGRVGSGWILDLARGQCASTVGRYCFVFNYTKFHDFILSYQRHKMPARSDQKKTQVGSQQESSSGPGQVLWPAQSPAAACLSVHRPHS